MFKTSNWIILILALLFTFYIPFEYNASLTDKMERESLRLETFALSSAQAALYEGSLTEDKVFEDEKVRANAIETFYEIYARCCNYPESEYYRVKYQIPCIILADYDGYYIAYTQWTTVTGETAYVDILTEKQTYSYQYGDYIVSYQLNDIVTVLDMTGQTGMKYKGTYEEVCNQIINTKGRIPEEISHFLNHDAFLTEKNFVVTYRVGNTAEYYVNSHNEFYNQKNVQYSISVPSTKEDDYADLLDEPSVICFIQGAQGQMEGELVNIYTYVAADLEDEMMYLISDMDGDLVYHKGSCNDLDKAIGYGNSYSCATQGANPHDCVYK